MIKQQLSYADAGVDMQAGDDLVERIKPFAKKTMREGVLAGIGGFGALFEISNKYKQPVLVSGTDGVGTKLKLAFELNAHDTIGQDLVAMSVNDILVQGAEPLFFLDYFACGKLDVAIAQRVIQGIAYGCELAGCALIGGETAEMPDMYPAGEYDLAGFAVGAVEKAHIINGKAIAPNDIILGLGSSGPHSNGYSLIRKILKLNQADLSHILYKDKTLEQAIMQPTRIYVKSILNLLTHMLANEDLKGLAHITGGGLSENIPRILSDNLQAQLNLGSWHTLPIFDWLQKNGNIHINEMHRVFNCGIGMIAVVKADMADKAIHILQENGENVYRIGTIQAKDINEPSVIYV
jgi:phosphoribosylformylglycinamidine cyclo-ligase